MKEYFDIIESDITDKQVLESILEPMFNEFMRVFHWKRPLERCIIYLDPEASCPMLVENLPFLAIRLNMEHTNYWSQLIYQLSHELCHYFIRLAKPNKDITIKWLEETICEAMSLYMLSFFANNWQACTLLYEKNPGYNLAIDNYFNRAFSKPYVDKFSECFTIKALIEIEKNCEEKREERILERNRLYTHICQHPLDCYCFLDYPKYISTRHHLLIDFRAWQKDDPSNKLIRHLNFLPPGNTLFEEEL